MSEHDLRMGDFIHGRPFLITYIVAIGTLLVLAAAFIVKLAFWTPCPASDPRCSADATTFAGIVFSVAATILTFIGLIAIGASWAGLYGEINKRVSSYAKDSIEPGVEDMKREIAKNIGDIQQKMDNIRHALCSFQEGMSSINWKDTQGAINSFRKVETYLPDDSEIQRVLGHMYSNLGNQDDAIKALKKAEQKLSDISDDAHFTSEAIIDLELGLVYRRRGDDPQKTSQEKKHDYRQAKKYLNRSLRLVNSDNCTVKALTADNADKIKEDAPTILGGIALREGDHKAARDYYQKAVNDVKNSPHALTGLASVIWFLDGLQKAETYFQDAKKAASQRISEGKDEVFWNHFDLALAQLAINDPNAEKNIL